MHGLPNLKNVCFHKDVFCPLHVVFSSVQLTINIIIIIRHDLGLDRLVPVSSNSLFNGLSSRLRPFGPHVSIIFGILLMFILVTCRSQFDLHLLRFSSTRSTFISSKISSFLLSSKTVYPAVIPNNFIWIDVNHFVSFFF